MVCLLTRVVVVVVVVALVVLIVAQREGVFRDEPRGALHAQRDGAPTLSMSRLPAGEP